MGLAAVALGTAGVVLADQFSRMLRRRAHERAGHNPEVLIGAAPAAAVDTVGVAVSGYAAASRSETVLFNLLAGFLGAFALVRLSTWGIRGDRWPFPNTRIRGRHIHHFVPGILIAFVTGAVGLVTESRSVETALAVPFGVGIGLTVDEAALLLDLEDVYWSREGLVSIQLSLGVASFLAAAVLGMRMLQRGEVRAEDQGRIPAV